jgi:hypothetical protein
VYGYGGLIMSNNSKVNLELNVEDALTVQIAIIKRIEYWTNLNNVDSVDDYYQESNQETIDKLVKLNTNLAELIRQAK